ncbi:MAG: amidohydrolase family protein [Rhodospirillales bacterium]
MPSVLTGGQVRSCDGEALYEAVAVGEGRVLGVGSASDMRRLAGHNAEEIDLRGATVLPGLIDTHPHMLHFAARSGTLVDLADARDHAEIVARIAARAAVTPKGQWIMTTPVGEPFYFIRRSWRDLAERRLPDRHVLDRATSDHPVFISAYGPVTPNVCAFNSLGLRTIGITSFIPDKVCNVEIEKDDTGKPSGILRGPVNNYYTFDPFWTQILLKLPSAAGIDLEATTTRAMAQYNRLGVTTAYEGHNMVLPHIDTYRRLCAKNAMTVRVLAALEIEPTAFPPFEPLTMAQFEANLDLARSLTSMDDDLLRIEGATLATGGPCWPGFMRMHEPYLDPYGQPTRGMTFVSLEKQDVFIRYCADHGMRANYLAGGHRDHDDFLESCERMAAEHAIRDRHWLIQHSIVTTQRQAERYRALGCDVTTSMSFSWGKGDLYHQRIGEWVLADLVPLKRLLNAGLTVACGSDWGPKNVFEHIALAQTHEFCGSGHRNDTPDHKVGRTEAIMMWTRDAAKVMRWTDIGVLRPGAQADLVLLDCDPFTCSLEQLPKLRVLRTYLSGASVYDSDAL